MLKTYPELRLPLDPFAYSLLQQAITRTPAAFRTYSFGVLDLPAVLAALRPFEIHEFSSEAIAGAVWAFAVEKLRSLEARGIVQAVTTAPAVPELRDALRAAEHPLLRLMADEACGCAVAPETAAALAELAGLPGFTPDAPGLLVTAI